MNTIVISSEDVVTDDLPTAAAESLIGEETMSLDLLADANRSSMVVSSSSLERPLSKPSFTVPAKFMSITDVVKGLLTFRLHWSVSSKLSSQELFSLCNRVVNDVVKPYMINQEEVKVFLARYPEGEPCVGNSLYPTFMTDHASLSFTILETVKTFVSTTRTNSSKIELTISSYSEALRRFAENKEKSIVANGLAPLKPKQIRKKK